MKNEDLSRVHRDYIESTSRPFREAKRYLSLLFLIFTLAIGQVWGAETILATFRINLSAAPTEKYASYSDADADYTCNKVGSNSSSNYALVGTQYYMKLTANDAYVKIKLKSGSIAVGDKVYVYHNHTSNKNGVGFAMTSGGTNGATGNATANTELKLEYTLTASDIAADGSISVYRQGSNLYVGKIEVVHPSSGGGGDPVDPTLTYNDGAYTIGGSALDLRTLIDEKQSSGAITYSVQTDNGTNASIAGVNFSAENVGTCVVRASQAEVSGTYNAKTVDFNVVVSAAPAYKLYYYFTKAADATTAGVTNNEDGFFTVSASGSNGTTGSITLHGTTYNCTNRTSNATTLATFTIPANKKGDLYGLLMSSGSSARGLLLDGVATGVSCAGGTDALKNIEINNIPAGTHTLTADANTRVGMFIMELTDGTYHTITLDLDGGTGATSVQALDGVAAVKPADPTKDHCAFAGWYNGASPYDWSAAVTGDLTLTAHWTQLYTISFANGGGSGDAPAAIPDKAQGETFEVPANTFTAPSASQEFDKWNDGTSDYAPGDTYTVGTANVVLTAQWKALVAKYTVIFKDGETTLDTKLVDVGSNPSDAGIDKTKPLFAFAAWQLSGSDIALDDASWASVAANAEVTLTARWAKAYASNADFEAYIIANKSEKDDADKAEAYVKSLNYSLSTKTGTTFDANDETNNGAYAGLKIKNAGTILSWNVVAGKVVELKAGVMVANGSLAINSGTPATIDGGSTTSGNDNYKIHYFYSATEALYEFTTSNGSAEVIKAITMRDPYTVSFEAHGDADPSALPGQPSVTLPAATNGTASLLGWFDAETGGNKIGDAGDSYTPTANITLHAQWEDVSTDARLASITLDPSTGVWEPAFDPEVVNYTYTMPYGTVAVPQITGATAVNAGGSYSIVSQASAWDETAVIRGVAASSDTKAYNITMKIAPKDGVSIIKVATTGGTNKTVTGLYAGDGDVNLSSSKKMDNGKYIGFTLAGTTLQAGDQINVHTSTAANTGGSHIIFYDNMTDKNELYDTEAIGGLGDNIFTINAAMVGQVSAYVYRSNADAAHQWNGYVDFIEVTRAMNPVLTAITFDGVNAEPGVGNTFSALLPNGTNLASMTVTPTIVWNGAGTAAPTAAWAWDTPITFRVTDKDGDYTDYTITLTEDVLKHTVSFNTHGGSAVDAQEVVDGENPVEPIEPTKEDFTFQGWAESDGGAIVDVTSFTITADKVFHAVWTSDGAIKLIEAGAINHTNFYTGAVMGTEPATVSIDDVDRAYAYLGSTASSPSGVNALNKLIAYNATTTQTKVMVDVYNSATSGRNVYIKGVVEGTTEVVDLANIALDNGDNKHVKTLYYEFNNAANRTIYISVPSSSASVYFLQVKVIESGTPLKKFGEVGYSINLSNSRFFGPKEEDLAFEGMNIELSSNLNALTAIAKLKATSIHFNVASPVTMTVTTANAATYYVATAADGTTNETAKTGASEFSLTAGTWYINAGTSEVQISNIAFSAPKCEKPVFTSLADIELCEGDPFTAFNGSATVSDGGTVTYQWYNEDDSEISGAIAATYTPSADGKYYVIATNSLAGFADNFAKSDLVTVEHVASAVITEAPLDQRILEGEDATLTVSATGKNLSYVWYTCDNKAGDNPVAIVPAETNASLTITVTAGLNQYYKVVVSSDCGNAEAVAKIEEWQEVELQDVTGDMAWDFSKSGVTSGTIEGEKVLANIYGVANNAEFRSDNIKANGNKFGNGYIQSAELMFHATVPGLLTVEFSNTGNKTNNRYLIVNGETTNVGINNQTHVTWSGVVPAGDVILTVTEADGGQMFNFFNISFEKIDYARAVNAGRYGTICLPKAGVMKEASLYEVAYKDASKIYFDEILSGEMVAGRPYIFLPNAGAKYIGVAYDDPSASPVAADSYNGLYGYYNLSYLDDADEREHPYNVLIGEYIISNNQYIKVNGNNSYIAQFRAYIKLNEIPGSAPAPAPGIRRIAMGYSGENTATGIDQITNEQLPMINKVIIDGQLFIFRGEKMYDATGRLVK